MPGRLIRSALVYAILAMLGGVFFREWTKALGFTGETTLAVLHTHYFAMGMVVFLLLALLQNAFPFMARRGVRTALVGYHAGLNVTVLGLLLRGLAQTTGTVLPRALDASLSGLSGLGHLTLGVSLTVLLLAAGKAAREKEQPHAKA
jgi:hypothetical protein